MQHIVTKPLLALHDRYNGDLGLLDERWAANDDRDTFTTEQIRTLGEYIETLSLARVAHLSDDLRRRTKRRTEELEELVDPEVAAILRQRLTL